MAEQRSALSAWLAAQQSAAERAFGRRHLAGGFRVNRDGRAKRPRQTLEARLGDMMTVLAVKRLHMQRDARIHGKSMEPLAHEVGVELTDLVPGETNLEHQDRSSRYVDDHARQGLIHGHVHAGVTGNSLHVAKRLLHRLSERDADVLGRVVLVDMQVAVGFDLDADARMAGKQVEHMVEETDARRSVGYAGAIEVHAHLDVRFFRLALDRRLAHQNPPVRPEKRGLLSGGIRFRHRRRWSFAAW